MRRTPTIGSLIALVATMCLAGADDTASLPPGWHWQSTTEFPRSLVFVSEDPVLEPEGTGVVVRAGKATADTQAGAPDLPRYAQLVRIPDSGRTVLQVDDGSYTDRLVRCVSPRSGRVYETTDSDQLTSRVVRQQDPKIYGKAGFWPVKTVETMQAKQGTNRYMRICVSPFQYDAVNGVLRQYKRITAVLKVEP